MGTSIKDKNRKIRQNALKEQLSNQGHIQHILKIADKLTDEYDTLTANQINALRSAAKIKFKLISLYVSDLSIRETLEDHRGGKDSNEEVSAWDH